VRRSVPSGSQLGYSCRHTHWLLIPTFAVVLIAQPEASNAGDDSPELIQPPICSAETAYQPALKGVCEVKPRDDNHPGNEVKINLTANTSRIEVGGYSVITEHYNDAYIPPVVRANPGDIVAAHLENLLAPRKHESMGHGDEEDNPTNLHYFHGGIVSPNNSRRPDDASSIDASKGNGDNIYVHLRAGRDVNGKPNAFDFEVPIPGERELDARVLETERDHAWIAHPPGLNWYHSHLHGISSDQVMGGLSGLLSVGEDKANVKAACEKDDASDPQCNNETAELRRITDVRYVLLRDISLRNIAAAPEQANGAGAEWAPEERDSPKDTFCGVWKDADSKLDPDPKLRKGYCQRDRNSVWLFTLNGQRFPTITIEGGHNALIRMANVSANVAYWLEMKDEPTDKDTLKLTILSRDGVVPAKTTVSSHPLKPILAEDADDLLLMPASRVEFYLRNDCRHTDEKVYILKTKGLIAGLPDSPGIDWWPAIQLARVVLKPSNVDCEIRIALNQATESIASPLVTEVAAKEVINIPPGCVRDLNPKLSEHRRITFWDHGKTDDGKPTDWSVSTEIVKPPEGDPPKGGFEEKRFEPDTSATVGRLDEKSHALVEGLPFEAYVKPDGTIDWLKNHACVFIDNAEHEGSHKQLWALVNKTSALHNFHIHQMKFRLATAEELAAHHIKLPMQVSTCQGQPVPCPEPDYKLYDDRPKDSKWQPDWHDTIPVPPNPGRPVFLIMSFDAKQQLGRFVFHCHILKHEDNGLMAPIEVWGPTTSQALRQ
jgi:FtsP/CotA-like multicopper oxidase with cupredoxin domain